MRRPPRRDDPPPLLFTFVPEAQSSVRTTMDWLATFDTAISERFVKALGERLTELCREGAREVPSQTHERASLHFSRPVFSARFRTGKASGRRSSAGVWYLFYDLVDHDADGFPDLLRVLAVRHAASAPIWQQNPTDDEDAH